MLFLSLGPKTHEINKNNESMKQGDSNDNCILKHAYHSEFKVSIILIGRYMAVLDELIWESILFCF